jgi:hypothetical protein
MGCQSALTCSSCFPGNFLATNGTCISCSPLYSGCSNCTSTACTACLTGYYPVNSTFCSVVPSANAVNNCYMQNSNMTCVICQLGYYLSNGQCNPYCSNLCTNCSGPHFGLCYACASNTVLFNMNCLPGFNIQNGLAYQYFITSRNNNPGFLPSTTSYCLETVSGYATSVQYTVNSVGGYMVILKWKLYMFNISNTMSTFGYNVTVNYPNFNTTYQPYYNNTAALNICTSQPNLQYV